jgi:DNA polymerase-3 subunit alpha
VTPLPRKELLAAEKELLGLYLSDHPLTELITAGAGRHCRPIIELSEQSAGQKVHILGMVAGVRRISTKTNRTMAIVTIEDLTGTIELVAFPDRYDEFHDLLQEERILDVTAKLDLRGDQLQLICESVTDELDLPKPPTLRRTVCITIPRTTNLSTDIDVMQDIDQIVREFAGDDELIVRLPLSRGLVSLRSRSRFVDWTDDLQRAVGEIVGPDSITVTDPSPPAPARIVTSPANSGFWGVAGQ